MCITEKDDVFKPMQDPLGKVYSEVVQEPLPLRPGILVKKSVVLVKRKNGFTKTVLWTENPGKIRTGTFW